MQDKAVWRVTANQARLERPEVAAMVELSEPQLGVRRLVLGGHDAADLDLLQVQPEAPDAPALQLRDFYVRDQDLVAYYEEADRDIVVQVYWRIVLPPAPAVVGLELIASVQTESLDSDPRLQIGSRIPADELLHLPDEAGSQWQRVDVPSDGVWRGAIRGALLYRSASWPYSYVEMTDAGDCRCLELAGSGAAGVVSRFHLFDDHLEKGVIRRARLRGAFLPRQQDATAAVACARQFARCELPLTA